MNILVSACLLGVACRYDGKSKEVERIKKLLSKYNLIPICPEQLGGLPTPRVPSERCGDKVINSQMEDVTLQYKKGAEEALRLAKIFNCSIAILSKTLITGNGTTTELLLKNGIKVFTENSPELESL